MRKLLYLFAGIVLVFALCGCSTFGALAERQTVREIVASAEETAPPAAFAEETPAPTSAPTAVPAPADTPAPTMTPAPTATPVPAASADYVLPESSVRRIEAWELYGLSRWECNVARNEIYARHGRIFRDEELAAYFASMPWYTPSVDPDTFDANASERLSQIELDNVYLILEYEESTFID